MPSSSPKVKPTVYILLLISVSIWGMSFVWTNQLLSAGLPVIAIILSRLLLSFFLLLLTVSLLRKRQRIKKEDIPKFFLLAFLEPFLYFIGETYGILKTTPTIASVLVSTIPLFTPIAAFYFFKERISFRNFFGIVASIIGVCLVIFHKGTDASISIEGLMLLILAITSAVFYSVVVRKLADRYNPFMIVILQNGIAALYFIPLFFLFDYSTVKQLSLGWGELYPLIMLAIFGSSVAFLFFVHAIKSLGMTRTNMFSTLIPVLTSIFAFIMGMEELSLLRVLGIIVVVGGLVLSQLGKRKTL